MGNFTTDTHSIANQTTTIPQAPKICLRLYLVRHGESEANQRGVFAGQLDSPLTERGVADTKSLGERSDFFISQQPVDSQPRRAEGNQKGLHPFFFHKVYSSDLVRAHDTCKLVLEALKLRQSTLKNDADKYKERTEPGIHSVLNDIRLDNRLRERSYGTLQGMPWGSNRSDTDTLWLETHEKDELPPIFESDDDIWIRVKEFLLNVIEDEVVSTTDIDSDSRPQIKSNEVINASNDAVTKHLLITSHGGVLRQILMRLVDVDKLKRMGAVYDPKRKNRLITPNASLSILDLSVQCLHQYNVAKVKTGDERNGSSQHDRNFRSNDQDKDVFEGINVELILLANTDHLKSGFRIHDD